jgi:hypothetical protein
MQCTFHPSRSVVTLSISAVEGAAVKGRHGAVPSLLTQSGTTLRAHILVTSFGARTSIRDTRETMGSAAKLLSDRLSNFEQPMRIADEVAKLHAPFRVPHGDRT